MSSEAENIYLAYVLAYLEKNNKALVPVFEQQNKAPKLTKYFPSFENLIKGYEKATGKRMPLVSKDSDSSDDSSEEDSEEEPTPPKTIKKPLMNGNAKLVNSVGKKQITKQSDSSEEDSSEDEKPKVKITPAVKKQDSDDSSEESSEDEAPPVTKKKESSDDSSEDEAPKQKSNAKKSSSEEDSSEEDENSKSVVKNVITKKKDESNDEDTSEEDEKPKSPVKNVVLKKKDESSDEDSSDDDETPAAIPVVKKQGNIAKKESSSESSDDSDDDPPPKSKISPAKIAKKDSSDDDSSSDDDETPTAAPIKIVKGKKDESSDDSDDDEEETPKAQVGQKRKADGQAGAPVNKKANYSNFVKEGEGNGENKFSTPKNFDNIKNNSKKMNGNNSFNKAQQQNGGSSNKNTPFRRVRDDEVQVDPRVQDNSFEAKDSDTPSDSSFGVILNDLNEDSSGSRPNIPGTTGMSSQTPQKHSKATTEKPTAASIHPGTFDMTKQDSTRDDYEVFGELVGRKVRILKTDYAKTVVQHLICNILFDAELGKFDVAAGTPASSSNDAPSATFCIHCNNLIDTTIMNEEQLINNLNTSDDQEMVPQPIGGDPLLWALDNFFWLNQQNKK